MKRREIDGAVRFVTFSCQHRLPLFSNPRIARVFIDAMIAARQRFRMRLFAWVVMPEHVHMLVRPSDGSELGPALRSMKMSVSKRVIARWIDTNATILQRIDDGHGRPRFWQKGGGFDRVVRSNEEFCREVHYVHHNPAERGLVERPRDWKWSSVRWWIGMRDCEVECDPPPGRPGVWTDWKGFV